MTVAVGVCLTAMLIAFTVAVARGAQSWWWVTSLCLAVVAACARLSPMVHATTLGFIDPVNEADAWLVSVFNQ